MSVFPVSLQLFSHRRPGKKQGTPSLDEPRVSLTGRCCCRRWATHLLAIRRITETLDGITYKLFASLFWLENAGKCCRHQAVPSTYHRKQRCRCWNSACSNVWLYFVRGLIGPQANGEGKTMVHSGGRGQGGCNQYWPLEAQVSSLDLRWDQKKNEGDTRWSTGQRTKPDWDEINFGKFDVCISSGGVERCAKNEFARR